MLDRSEVGKRGYLDRDFRLVHLKDSLAQKIDYHYHEFDKLVIFLGGKVTYVVEGVTYFLKPWDIVLIQHNLIHRPARSTVARPQLFSSRSGGGSGWGTPFADRSG